MSRRGINHSFGFTATPGIRAQQPVPVAPHRVRNALVDGMGMLVLTAPIHVVSEANQREHWAVKGRRTKDQRATAGMVCRSLFGRPPPPPLTVQLIRIAPRELNRHDNLPGSFKAVCDGICDWLGIPDEDKRIQWGYAQEKGSAKQYGIRIELTRGSS